MHLSDDYNVAYEFLSRIWERERDEDLAALLGSMELVEFEDGSHPADRAFEADWKRCAQSSGGDADGYCTMIKFLEEKAQTWSAASDYLPSLTERLKGTEQNQMRELWNDISSTSG